MSHLMDARFLAQIDRGEVDQTHRYSEALARHPGMWVTRPGPDLRDCLGCGGSMVRPKEVFAVMLPTGEWRTVCSGLCATKVSGKDTYKELGQQYAAHTRMLKLLAQDQTDARRARDAAVKAEGERRNAAVIASRTPDQQRAARDRLGRWYIAPPSPVTEEELQAIGY